MAIPKVSAASDSGLRDDHDPSDMAQKAQQKGLAACAPHEAVENKGQGIVRDGRGQDQPADKKRAQQTSKTGSPQVSQNGGYSSSGGKGQP